MVGPELTQRVRGLQGRNGSLVALVPCAPARAVGCLLQSFYRQYPESYRNAVPHRDLLQTAGGFAGHILEVRCVSPDNRAKSDDTAITPGSRPTRGRGRQLDRAGEPQHV